MFSVLVVALPLLSQPPSESTTTLWAGISVQQPVFGQRETAAKLILSFAVVNDGTSDFNPNIEFSHLFINGVEPQSGFGSISGKGLRTPEWKILPPGPTLTF